MAGLVNVDVGSVTNGLFNLIDNLFTSDEERLEAKQKVLRMEQEGQLAQIGVNVQEAKHESVFVAGWRPFVGWVCGSSLAYTYILEPVARFGAAVYGDPQVMDLIHGLPQLDLSTMLPVLLGMLGLGGLRTYEKRKGVNKNR
jgi:hypothetical protein